MPKKSDPDLRRVRRSRRIGAKRWPFPSRRDYINWARSHGRIEQVAEFDRSPQLVAEIQRHWHESGQNGCRFAQLLSKGPAEHGWRVVVVVRGYEKGWLNRVLPDIHQQVARSIRHPATQALSFLFPGITTIADLVQLLVRLDGLEDWAVEEPDEPIEIDGRMYVPVGVRVLLGHKGVRSWALGFGPFPFLPATRQAPFTELVLATKPKVFPLRDKRLNSNPLLAHLADVSAPVDDEDYGRLWSSTGTNKADILNGQRLDAARARVTFIVPRRQWDAARWR